MARRGPWRRARCRAAEPEDLRALSLGDTVEHGGGRWTVLGRLDFEEVGVRWTELVLDTDARTWLTVEDLPDDGGLEVSWWTGLTDGDVEEGGPGDDVVVAGGAAYHLQHRGEASFLASGTTGTPPRGSCAYADYRTPERLLLGFENYGTSWRTARGRIIAPEQVGVTRTRG